MRTRVRVDLYLQAQSTGQCLQRPLIAFDAWLLALSAAENFLQRIARRPASYPIFGDIPRPVDWDWFAPAGT
jgi:hypothetical protein